MRKYLNHVKRNIQSIKHDINEINTITKVILPLLDILGWDTLSWDVEQEYKDEIDILLKIDEEPKLVVEAKRFGIDLTEEHAKQAINYTNKTAGVRWCLLTNGIDMEIYDTYRKSKRGDRFYKLSINEFNSKFDLLWLLSKYSMERDSLNFIKEKVNKLKSEIPTKHYGYIDTAKMIMNVIKGTRLPTKESLTWKKNELFDFLDERNPRQLEFLRILSRRKSEIYHEEMIKRLKNKLGKKFSGDLRGPLAGISIATNSSKKEGIYISKWESDGHFYQLKSHYRNQLQEYFREKKITK